MQQVTAAELATLVGAQVLGDDSALIGPEVVIDSRAATGGCLFVALPGARVDGHDFAASALVAGAGGVLVDRDLSLPTAQLVVTDPAAALARLARGLVASRLAQGLTSIGITGSSGKTSTKDLLAQILAEAGPTVSPIGSANNEIGVPLTATRVDASTRFLVSELGARGQGHISWLCDIVTPSVGAVLNVGSAHVGEFGSVAAIAAAKAELVTALPADGWAVLNAEDRLVAAMRASTEARIAAFSTQSEPEFGELRVWAEQVSCDQRQRPGFILRAGGLVAGTEQVRLRVSGRHQVANALAAAAVALSQGISVSRVASALGRAEIASRWRMELADAPSGLLVVNDAYNANPDSMAAALRAVAGMRRRGGKLLAVLGDMLELGTQAAAAHRKIGELAAELGFDQLFVLGQFAADLKSGAERGGVAAAVLASQEAAVAAINASAQPQDVVLVKASRGLALEAVAQSLASHGATEGEQ